MLQLNQNSSKVGIVMFLHFGQVFYTVYKF